MIKIGIIGESEGNGHPFSWSAIVNGYYPEKMGSCDYESIPKYLARQEWERPHVPNAIFTHIWTEEISRTKFIAETCKNLTVATSLRELVSKVDAIIIARDDYLQNLRLAKDIAGQQKPILFDKQIAGSLDEARNIVDICRIKKSPVFSGSPISHYNQAVIVSWLQAHSTTQIIAVTPKKWYNYAIHIVDPIITAMNSCKGMSVESINVLGHSGSITSAILHVARPNMPSLEILLRADSNYQGGFKFMADANDLLRKQEYVIGDPFEYFKAYLNCFVNFCETVKDKEKSAEALKMELKGTDHHLYVQSIIDTVSASM